jgi:hypothetical protein
MSWKETMVFFLPFPSRTTWRKTEGQSCRMSIIPALSSQRGHVGKICLAELHFGTWFGDLISLWRPLYDRLRPLEHELFFGYSLQSDTIWHPLSLGKILFFFYTGDFPVFCLSHWVIRAVYSTMGVGQDMKSQQLPYKRCWCNMI